MSPVNIQLVKNGAEKSVKNRLLGLNSSDRSAAEHSAIKLKELDLRTKLMIKMGRFAH